MRRQVIEVIRETFPFDQGQIEEGTRLSEFIRDSIDAVELVAVLTTEYTVRIDPADLQQVQTVADVVGYVERRSGVSPVHQPLESF